MLTNGFPATNEVTGTCYVSFWMKLNWSLESASTNYSSNGTVVTPGVVF